MGTSCSKDYNREVEQREKQKLAKIHQRRAQQLGRPPMAQRGPSPIAVERQVSVGAGLPPQHQQQLQPQQQSPRRMDWQGRPPMAASPTPSSRNSRQPSPFARRRMVSATNAIMAGNRMRRSSSQQPQRPRIHPDLQRELEPVELQVINMFLVEEIQARTEILHQQQQQRILIVMRADEERMGQPVKRAMKGLTHLEMLNRGTILNAEAKHRQAIMALLTQEVVDAKLAVFVAARLDRSWSQPASELNVTPTHHRMGSNLDYGLTPVPTPMGNEMPHRQLSSTRVWDSPQPFDTSRHQMRREENFVTPNKYQQQRQQPHQQQQMRPAPQPVAQRIPVITPTRAAPQAPRGGSPPAAQHRSRSPMQTSYLPSALQLADQQKNERLSQAQIQLLLDRLRQCEAQETAARNSLEYEETARFQALRSGAGSMWYDPRSMDAKIRRQRELLESTRGFQGLARETRDASPQRSPERSFGVPFHPVASGVPDEAIKSSEKKRRSGHSVMSADGSVAAVDRGDNRAVRDESMLAMQQRLAALTALQ